jgi:3-oxoacyl-[acyl-carrier protein] reductase
MGVIVVAGASGTIGIEVCRRLIKSDRQTLLIGRHAEKLAKLSEEIGQPYLVVDYSASDTLHRSVASVLESYGPVEGVVNLAGSLFLKPIYSTSLQEFREVLEANLVTAFQIVKLGSQLLSRTGGAIVLFASAAAEVGMPNHESIAAAKAGVIGLARSAAASLANRNIRVNVVSPGLIKTELTRRIWEVPTSVSAACDMHALGRLGEPSKIASLVEWLLDEENDWITGQAIGIDGGLSHVLSRRRG